MNIPKKAIFIATAIVAAIIIVAAITPNTNRYAGKSSSSWYAVHLTNGQIYYGRLHALTDTTLALADTHYFEVYTTSGSDNTATSTSFEVKSAPQTVYNLVRQGSDQNTATDHTIFFNRAAVLYWEQLDQNAGVVQNIIEAAKNTQ